MEKTFIILKPGVLQRRITGEILTRLERKGLKIIALKLVQITKTLAETHYAEHIGKEFYQRLIDYTLSGPVVVMILEGDDAISIVRCLIGPTNIHGCPPGTIRGDFAAKTLHNIIHASDSKASAEREIALFFTPEEIYNWEDGNEQWF